MAFPVNPTDQQLTTVNNIKYIYSSADNSWTKTGEVAGFQVDGNLSVTGNAIVSAGVYADQYFYANGTPFVGGGGGTGVLNNWSLITANYTAVTGDRILANTALGSFTVFLPATPGLGESVQITDAYNFGDFPLIIDPNGSTIEGLTAEIEVNIPAIDIELVYGEDTWQLITTIGPQGSQGNIGYTGSSAPLSAWQVITSNHTATTGERLVANTSSGSFTISLPASPTIGDFIQITDGYNFAANNLVIDLNGNTLENTSDNLEIDISSVDLEFFYDGSTWQLISTTGPQGYTGSAGADGTIGVDGYTGSQGIQGNIGYTGSEGFTGSQGETGLGFRIAKSYLSLAALTADTSPTGIVAGEFAIIETGDVEDTDNSKLYLWTGSAYTYVTDLSGAAGITGPQGFTGSQGIQGIQGNVGYTGSAGIQGNIGYTGSAGADGTIGVDGYTGSQGIQGNIGYTGSEGVGYTGSEGAQGIQGNIGYTGSAGTGGSGAANVVIQDANVTITNAVTSINFLGSGVAATATDGNVTVTIPGIVIDGATSLSFVRSFTGDGTVTAYDFQGTVLDQTQLVVHVDGIYQTPGVNFTANANWINFSAAPDANAEIVVQSYSNTLLAEPITAGATIPTTVNTQPTMLDSFSSVEFRTAKYILSVSGDGDYQSAEALLTHDDIDSYLTVYSVLYTGNSEIMTFSANLESNTVKLYGTSISNTSQVKMQRTYVRV